jgi:hypothetical protein
MMVLVWPPVPPPDESRRLSSCPRDKLLSAPLPVLPSGELVCRLHTGYKTKETVDQTIKNTIYQTKDILYQTKDTIYQT